VEGDLTLVRDTSLNARVAFLKATVTPGHVALSLSLSLFFF
jgi:hypothetical protein